MMKFTCIYNVHRNILSVKYGFKAFYVLLQVHTNELCYTMGYGGISLQYTLMITVSNVMKFICITDMFYMLFTEKCGMHCIYCSFTRKHKRVRLQYCLLTIIDASTFQLWFAFLNFDSFIVHSVHKFFWSYTGLRQIISKYYWLWE